MNAKPASLLKVFSLALALSVTAGCATARAVFAPGMVVEAKSLGIAAANQVALVPGGVDLAMSHPNPRPSFGGALVPGGVDLAVSRTSPHNAFNGALVSGSLDLANSIAARPSIARVGLAPGSVDLGRPLKGPSTVYFGDLVPGSVDLGVSRQRQGFGLRSRRG
jgi:hypothetical protein